MINFRCVNLIYTVLLSIKIIVNIELLYMYTLKNILQKTYISFNL